MNHTRQIIAAALLSVDSDCKARYAFGRNLISHVAAGVSHHLSKAKTSAVTSLTRAWPQVQHARRFPPINRNTEAFFLLFSVILCGG